MATHTAPKTLIFGPGFIGTRLNTDLANSELTKCDVRDLPAVRKEIERTKAEVVINAAGKTGSPNVDWCESHPVETFSVNVSGAINLAIATHEAGCHLIHLGSGCIFYGDSPSPGGWREEDFANPESLYSRSKYAADLALSRFSNTAIARLRMPIDDKPGPRNLISKLAKYDRVVDVLNSVTVVEDLVNAVRKMSEVRATGIFHVVNPGPMRHKDLLNLYKEVVDPKHTYQLIHEDDLVKQGLAVKRRSNCILADTRLSSIGVELRPLGEALRATMEIYGANS